jgi:xanthine/uracil permease
MLPFTAEILFASMSQYNQALWPLPPIALLLGLGAVLLTVRPVRDSNRLIGGYLAAAWLWVGIVYHMLHFARLDFAAPLYGALFVLEGLLLLWLAVQGRLAFSFHGGPIGWVGLALAMLAVAWPLVDRLSGLTWQAERVVGLAPAPTAVLTLALLLLADRRGPPYLAIIPLLWTLIAGATAWLLWIPQDLALPVVGLVGFALLLWKNRRYAAGRSRARRTG